jgi:hypothetical protein
VKALLASLVVFFSALFFAPQITSAAFDPLGQACSGNAGSSTACTESETGKTIDNPVTDTSQSVINIISVVSAVAAVVVIIVAGVTMTLSQGDSGKIKSSRDAIIYAAVGLVVTALARTIVIFILNRTR